MKRYTAVVLGATGLIGSSVVDQLLKDPSFEKVRILVRRDYVIQHEKLVVERVDFNNMDDVKNKLGTGDCLFCCVGTTNRKVSGDKNEYRKVDFDIPVHAAQLASKAGFQKYLLVSAVSANASSTNFYVRLKGEVEEAIVKYPFDAIHIFQPSILFGKRSEMRIGELIGKGIMKVLSPLLSASMSKYKGIEGADVAKAMIAASKSETTGIHKYQYKEMMQLIRQDQHQV